MMRFGKCLLFGSLVCAVSTWAVKAAPFLINSTQPDGSVVQIRNVGNEHFHYTVTDEDSVLVSRDSSGYWNYADENGEGVGMRFHPKSKRGKKELNFLKNHKTRDILEKFRKKGMERLREKRQKEEEDALTPSSASSSTIQRANGFGGWWGWNYSSSSFNTENDVVNTNTPRQPTTVSVKRTGDVRGIVVLVQFSDVKFSRDNANSEYYDYLNKEGYSNYHMTGSARDFFVKNSAGQYRPTFDVYGPITLSGTRDSYGDKAYRNSAQGAVNAIKEAMDQLIAEGVDFSPYDSDGDKVVDFVYMIYAGVGSADSDVPTAIWPHSYEAVKRLTKNYYMQRYACSPEIDGQSYVYNRKTTTLNGIGTFCHEFSHVLGLMDHYDVYDENQTRARYTPIKWDLMDSGSYNCPTNSDYSTGCSPANLSAFERFSLGWLTPRRLEISDTTFVLDPISENDGLVLTSENDNEYYFVDFRLQEGFDVALPNKGMLIWHIYYSDYYWSRNEVNIQSPMRVDLIEADGIANVNTMTTDAFPTSRVKSFNGFVTWAGDSLGLEIYDIKIANGQATFKTRGSRVSPVQESSSSAAKVSSSSAAEESSSSSAEEVLSSDPASSSSLEAESSSSENTFAFTGPGIGSSSSESTLTSGVVLGKTAVRFSVTDGVLMVNANLSGRKTIRLFDVNGALLLTKTFESDFCEIPLSSLNAKSFVVGSLDLDGHLVKTIKVRIH